MYNTKLIYYKVLLFQLLGMIETLKSPPYATKNLSFDPSIVRAMNNKGIFPLKVERSQICDIN